MVREKYSCNSVLNNEQYSFHKLVECIGKNIFSPKIELLKKVELGKDLQTF